MYDGFVENNEHYQICPEAQLDEVSDSKLHHILLIQLWYNYGVIPSTISETITKIVVKNFSNNI